MSLEMDKKISVTTSLFYDFDFTKCRILSETFSKKKFTYYLLHQNKIPNISWIMCTYLFYFCNSYPCSCGVANYMLIPHIQKYLLLVASVSLSPEVTLNPSLFFFLTYYKSFFLKSKILCSVWFKWLPCWGPISSNIQW